MLVLTKNIFHYRTWEMSQQVLSGLKQYHLRCDKLFQEKEFVNSRY